MALFQVIHSLIKPEREREMLRKISVDLSLYNDVLVQAGMKVLMYINMSSSLGHVSLFQTYSVLFI